MAEVPDGLPHAYHTAHCTGWAIWIIPSLHSDPNLMLSSWENSVSSLSDCFASCLAQKDNLSLSFFFLTPPPTDCFYQRAKSSKEISSAVEHQLLCIIPPALFLEPIICHPLNKQAPYHIINIYLTLFTWIFSRQANCLMGVVGP